MMNNEAGVQNSASTAEIHCYGWANGGAEDSKVSLRERQRFLCLLSPKHKDISVKFHENKAQRYVVEN